MLDMSLTGGWKGAINRAVTVCKIPTHHGERGTKLLPCSLHQLWLWYGWSLMESTDISSILPPSWIFIGSWIWYWELCLNLRWAERYVSNYLDIYIDKYHTYIRTHHILYKSVFYYIYIYIHQIWCASTRKQSKTSCPDPFLCPDFLDETCPFGPLKWMTEVGQVGGYDEYTSWIVWAWAIGKPQTHRWALTFRTGVSGAVVTFPHEKTEQWTNQNLWWFVFKWRGYSNIPYF